MNWTVIGIVYPPNHLIVKSLLESSGIPVQLRFESIAAIQAVTRGPLAEVQILVPQEFEATALGLLDQAPAPEATLTE